MLTETFHQILAVIPVSYNEFSMGIGYGWTAPVLNKLKSSGEYTVEELSWIGSIHEFGRAIGPPLAALLLDRLGRKKLLILCSLIFLLSWFFIIFVKSVLWICLSRLAFGIGNGINDVISPIYLGENYPPNVRGLFCSIICLCFCLAELIQFIIASIFPYQTVAIINCTIAFLGVFTTFCLVETPQFLLIKKKFHLAEKNFQWLRGTSNPDRVDELEKIKQNIEEERLKKLSWKELFTARANYKSLIIIFMLNVLTTGTGYAAVLSYMTLVFSSSTSFSEYEFTIFYGIIQLMGSVSVPAYIERFDRRTLVLISYVFIFIFHMATAILLYVQTNVTPVLYFPWLIFATISTYGAIYVILFPIIHIIRGELLPQSIKAIGGFVAITIYSATSFITTRIFLSVATTYGTHVNFLIYGVFSALAFVYNYSQLPETRGRMLVDIQKNLEK